jgi:hypothetical protein
LVGCERETAATLSSSPWLLDGTTKSRWGNTLIWAVRLFCVMTWSLSIGGGVGAILGRVCTDSGSAAADLAWTGVSVTLKVWECDRVTWLSGTVMFMVLCDLVIFPVVSEVVLRWL